MEGRMEREKEWKKEDKESREIKEEKEEWITVGRKDGKISRKNK